MVQTKNKIFRNKFHKEGTRILHWRLQNMLKEFKENLNKWKDIMCSRTQIINWWDNNNWKDDNTPKLTCEHNVTTIKIHHWLF